MIIIFNIVPHIYTVQISLLPRLKHHCKTQASFYAPRSLLDFFMAAYSFSEIFFTGGEDADTAVASGNTSATSYA